MKIFIFYQKACKIQETNFIHFGRFEFVANLNINAFLRNLLKNDSFSKRITREQKEIRKLYYFKGKKVAVTII